MPARTCPWTRQIATVRSRGSSRSAFIIGYAAVRNSELLRASENWPRRKHWREATVWGRLDVIFGPQTRADAEKSGAGRISKTLANDELVWPTQRSALTHLASRPPTSHSHSGGPARRPPRRQNGMDGGEGGTVHCADSGGNVNGGGVAGFDVAAEGLTEGGRKAKRHPSSGALFPTGLRADEQQRRLVLEEWKLSGMRKDEPSLGERSEEGTGLDAISEINSLIGKQASIIEDPRPGQGKNLPNA
ncbi:hypothetical protein CMUS01_09005 [Colletotrichum musicola]|uniref:Uncharacterized protein n=1 Tax=Colletotrichum musicola TaxID=2175873 RepID=A0A8H6KAQ3_9PEZI|nr:hypothetical protein CMUS01_09005 [Colletotrichum musicola]